MGASPSTAWTTYLPESIPICGTGSGARWSYECTTRENVRYALTLLHLVVLVLTFLVALVLYLIMWGISERRAANRLRMVPSRLPIGRDILSAHMHGVILQRAARVSEERFGVGKPPNSLREGISRRELAEFRAGVFAALQRLSEWGGLRSFVRLAVVQGAKSVTPLGVSSGCQSCRAPRNEPCPRRQSQVCRVPRHKHHPHPLPSQTPASSPASRLAMRTSSTTGCAGRGTCLWGRATACLRSRSTRLCGR